MYSSVNLMIFNSKLEFIKALKLLLILILEVNYIIDYFVIN